MFPWPDEFTLAWERWGCGGGGGWGGGLPGLLLVWPINKKGMTRERVQVECGRGFRTSSSYSYYKRGSAAGAGAGEGGGRAEAMAKGWSFAALFVIWITWQVARAGLRQGCSWAGKAGREIIPRDSIYACLNVFDCALLIQTKKHTTLTQLQVEFLLLLFCFPAVSWAAAQIKNLPIPYPSYCG